MYNVNLFGPTREHKRDRIPGRKLFSLWCNLNANPQKNFTIKPERKLVEIFVDGNYETVMAKENRQKKDYLF
jgi:hypothetical protein